MAWSGQSKFGQYWLFRKLKRYKVLIGLLVMLLSAGGYMPSASTSILCDDPSIRRIHTTDTVPVSVLLSMCSITPFINAFLLEWLIVPKIAMDSSGALRRSWRLLRDTFQGQLVMLLIVEFLKLSVSEARPHFMQTCAPDLSETDCSNGYVTISWHNCTNPNDVSKRKLKESMKSFPSGHALLGAFITVYMSLYVLHRVRLPSLRWVAIWLCLCWMVWGGVCGISRIWDNRHHWWDVLTGYILGAVGAQATIRYFSNNFKFLAHTRRSSVDPASEAQMEDP